VAFRAASKHLSGVSPDYYHKIRYRFGFPYSHLLLGWLTIGRRSLLDSEDFDIHWILEHSFRNDLPVQVLP
jgi:hypothetical protein